jgi:phage baseplate assembly protein W
MNGVNSRTGKRLSGVAHLRQSVSDILTTPIGSRVLVRDYGSDLFSLVDNPRDDLARLQIIAASATALARWEPRLKVTRVLIFIDLI